MNMKTNMGSGCRTTLCKSLIFILKLPENVIKAKIHGTQAVKRDKAPAVVKPMNTLVGVISGIHLSNCLFKVVNIGSPSLQLCLIGHSDI
jgi:hypothetical protein